MNSRKQCKWRKSSSRLVQEPDECGGKAAMGLFVRMLDEMCSECLSHGNWMDVTLMVVKSSYVVDGSWSSLSNYVVEAKVHLGSAALLKESATCIEKYWLWPGTKKKNSFVLLGAGEKGTRLMATKVHLCLRLKNAGSPAWNVICPHIFMQCQPTLDVAGSILICVCMWWSRDDDENQTVRKGRVRGVRINFRLLNDFV